MSVDVITAVKSRQVGSTTSKLILMILADYADANWSSFASQKRLAAEAEVSERTVSRVLQAFEKRGVVKREARYAANGHRTSDRITLVEEAICRLPDAVSGSDDSTTRHSRRDYPTTATRLPDTDDATTRQALAEEPSVEPSQEPSDEQAAAEFERLCITIAEEHVDQRGGEGYPIRNRGAFVAHLAKSPEVRNEALKRTPVAGNVLELLDGIGRPMDGETA